VKGPVGRTVPAISAESLALNSLAFGCSSADGGLKNLPPGLSSAQRLEFLQEHILFHHFMAMSVAASVIPDLESRHAYCEKMVEAIDSESRLLLSGELGLPPLKHFSKKDQEDAIRICLLNHPNIIALLGQELYIARNPSESELKLMNLFSVRDMTDWDSPSRSLAQYFAAALLARLAVALEINLSERIRDLIDLSIYTVSETLSAFELYVDLLGAKVPTENGHEKELKPNEAKGNWFSNLFKQKRYSSSERDEPVESPAPLPAQRSAPAWAQSENRRTDPVPEPLPRKVEASSADIPAEMIEKGVYLRRNQFRGISDWEERMFSEFGEKVIPLLGRIWNSTS
jgi:hypothetical protein